MRHESTRIVAVAEQIDGPNRGRGRAGGELFGYLIYCLVLAIVGSFLAFCFRDFSLSLHRVTHHSGRTAKTP